MKKKKRTEPPKPKKVYLIITVGAGQILARSNKLFAWRAASHILGFDEAGKTTTAGGWLIRYQDICNIERETGALDITLTGPEPDKGTVRILMLEVNGAAHE